MKEVKNGIMEILGVREGLKDGKYLGLPSAVGRSKKRIFQETSERVKKKLKGWKEKSMSKGGKEVLIKACAQAIPMYVMNTFLLPETLIDEMHRALNLFWWGNGKKQNPIRWCRWEDLCVSKSRGGVGFRHLGAFNRSILAKQGWRLMTRPNSLAARVLKARYHPRSSFLEAKVGYKPSFVWRSLMASQDIVAKGTRWSIGDGSTTRIWEDLWVVGQEEKLSKPPQCEFVSVRELMESSQDGWNEELICNIFDRPTAEKILSMFCCKEEEDSLYWDGTPNGEFSVKSAYHLIAGELCQPPPGMAGVDPQVWKKIWHADIPPKVKVFAWRTICNCLPTGANFARRGLMLNNNGCTHCGWPLEDIHHVLFDCSLAKHLWGKVSRRWNIMFKDEDETKNIFLTMASAGVDVFAEFIVLCWGLWNGRNKKFHDNEVQQPDSIAGLSKTLLHDFRRANMSEPTEDNDSATSNVKWNPPPPGLIKINSDASWFGGNKVAGLGFVCRNSEGKVVLAGTRTGFRVASVLEAEARGILFALESAGQWGLTRCVVETDSLSLSRALAESKNMPSIANVLGSIRRAANQVIICDWSFVRREGNRVAHELGAWAVRMNQSQMFVDVLPRVAEEVMCSDLDCL